MQVRDIQRSSARWLQDALDLVRALPVFSALAQVGAQAVQAQLRGLQQGGVVQLAVADHRCPLRGVLVLLGHCMQWCTGQGPVCAYACLLDTCHASFAMLKQSQAQIATSVV